MRRRSDLFTISVPELAAELNVTVEAIAYAARLRAFEIRTRHGHPAHDGKPVRCLTAKDAATIRAAVTSTHAQPEDVSHWLTAPQAARALGLTLTSFYNRRQKGSVDVRYVDVVGMGGRGRRTRYDPKDVQREAARLGIRPRQAPRGTLPSSQFAELTGTTRKILWRWVGNGCPHIRTTDNDLHFRPEAVLAWLISRDWSGPRFNRGRLNVERAIAALTPHLNTEEERAA